MPYLDSRPPVISWWVCFYAALMLLAMAAGFSAFG